MKPIVLAATSLLAVSLLSACGKKAPAPDAAPAAPAAVPAPAPAPAAQAEPTDAEREKARKQALLDYATMEDGYIHDPHAQWASTAKASSTFGEGNGAASNVNAAANAVGPVDGEAWTNNRQDIGFDTLEAGFAKPVHATGVRIVFENGKGVEAASKLEVQGTDGTWRAVWSGLSDIRADARGSRTWFVRSFERTADEVSAVRLTIANNVQSGYKEVDAVQLIGE